MLIEQLSNSILSKYLSVLDFGISGDTLDLSQQKRKATNYSSVLNMLILLQTAFQCHSLRCYQRPVDLSHS